MRFLRRLLGRLVLLLDTALLTLFALAYAARYLRPGDLTWWMQMLAVGMPFLSMGVVVAALVAFAARKRRVAHAIALGLVLLRFGLPVGGDTPREGDLSIVTYNLPRYWGGMADTSRDRAVEAFVREAAPALMALQETGSMVRDSFLVFHPQVGRVHNRLGYTIPISESHNYSHNTTLLRFEPERTENLRFKLEPGEPPAELQRVYFTWNGQKAVLYNIHLRSYGRSKPWQNGFREMFDLATWKPFVSLYRDAVIYRAIEADTIRTLIDQEEAAVIVAGDFNGTAHNWAYKRLSENMTDAFKHAGRGWGATYHIKLPVARIDFVLAGPEWSVVQARVPDVALSDHRPVAVTLRLREEGASDSVRTAVRPFPVLSPSSDDGVRE